MRAPSAITKTARRDKRSDDMKPVSPHNSPLIAPTVGVIDPVCGMNVDLNTTPYRAEYAGKTYGFCSATCQSKFTAEPTRYFADVAKPGRLVRRPRLRPIQSAA